MVTKKHHVITIEKTLTLELEVDEVLSNKSGTASAL